MNLPEAFIQRMRLHLGAEADAFFNALNATPPTSIRLHHKKGKTSFLDLEQVLWCDTGFYLDNRPYFHLDPHWHAGAYYVQEASSMILDHVIKQLHLDESPKIWLDTCAAPGGKTGILAKHLKPGDVLVANEIIPQRRSVLRENLYKGGYVNTFISGEQSSAFTEPFADVILIDAPCAGEGMMRKEPEAIRQWSPSLVKECSIMQQRIVADTVRALQPNGYLIYSTCSYSQDENFENVKRFAEEHSLKSLKFEFPEEWGITPYERGGHFGYQLYPHKVKGEGLFISVLQKEEASSSKTFIKKTLGNFIPIPDWLNKHVADEKKLLVQRNKVNYPFITEEAEEKANIVMQRLPRAELLSESGQLKGKDFIPAHFLAMSGMSEGYQMIELGLDQCLDYFEREIKSLPVVKTDGWYLVSFDGVVIGWAKKTNQGWKNHYPLHWRLRSRKI